MANAAPRKARDSSTAPVTADSVTWRSLEVLGAFDAEHPQLSLSEIARRTGLPLATAHRLSGELLRWGALGKDQNKFVIGQRLWQIGRLAPVQQDIAELASPYMQDVLFVTQNVVNLFILDREAVLLLERISGTRAGSPFRRVGSHLSLHASAAGKIMLAHIGMDLLPEATKLKAVTDHTIVDRQDLETEIRRVRQQGFATTSQESGLDNYGLAVPIQLPTGRVVAALGVVSQGQAPSIGSVVPVLRIAARGIARSLARSEMI
ncbi:IclR family transcriptional regulator [Paeniglutamicibacter gangotriensis]|uniref:IclR family transcriptional regulator n=1 Tax=Paeniglutamicibacter gangotriensis Lz1y TaxID=1276920 RepID=M7MV57_9MICC|nr:IclR family transcriptional regulator [Paeniglutamicibacter gangotriensis]EMR00318.1 IclR family transcriptional regulator [Paeniglutamicibacter gangotriensis Lz1y]